MWSRRACFLLLFSAPILRAQMPVTFSKDVAPILFGHCAVCQHPNDIAPMSLLTYKETRPWAAAIRQAVVTRKMPPWHADPHVGQYLNDARLSDAQISKIVKWVETGATSHSSHGTIRLSLRLSTVENTGFAQSASVEAHRMTTDRETAVLKIRVDP